MRARIFQLCTALFVSAAAWLHQPSTVVSCSPYDPESVHIVCFDPRVLPDSLYQYFMNVAMNPAVGITQEDLEDPHYTDDTTEISFNQNIHEWGEYFHNRVPLGDIDAFVYIDPKTLLEKILDTLRKGKVPEPPSGMD